jgi:hypothetical protein
MYLMGQQFTLQTDHHNLLYMQTCITPKVQRWRMQLQQYDFTVTHIADRYNVIADALSRFNVLKMQQYVISLRNKTPYEKFQMLHNSVTGHYVVRHIMRQLKDAGANWATKEKELTEFCQIFFSYWPN